MNVPTERRKKNSLRKKWHALYLIYIQIMNQDKNRIELQVCELKSDCEICVPVLIINNLNSRCPSHKAIRRLEIQQYSAWLLWWKLVRQVWNDVNFPFNRFKRNPTCVRSTTVFDKILHNKRQVGKFWRTYQLKHRGLYKNITLHELFFHKSSVCWFTWHYHSPQSCCIHWISTCVPL